MHLVQLLIPVVGNDGEPFPPGHFAHVREVLVREFGGVTAYSRAPARGAWRDGLAAPVDDDVVLCEVMVTRVDREWWAQFRRDLERLFQQDEIVIRAHTIERL